MAKKSTPAKAAKTAFDAITEPLPAPMTLSADAATEWPGIIGTLAQLGTARHADLRAIELLCEVLASERQLRDTLAREGLTIDGANDNAKAHPGAKLLESTRNQAHRLLSDFGMIPRGRVSVKPLAPPKENPFANLIGKNTR